MRRSAGLTLAALLLVVVLAPAPLAGQEPVRMPSPGDATPKLDSLQQRLHDALIAVRDTLQTVSAATATLRRDVSLAANITVTAKASRLVARCGVGVSAVAHADSVISSMSFTGRARSSGRVFEQTGADLRRALETHCLRGLASAGPGVRADTLRAWTPYHTAKLNEAIGAYQAAGSRLAHDFGVRLEPNLPN